MPTKRIGTGDGRPNEWLREKCREIVKRDKIIDFLADVAKGKDVEQAVGDQGEAIRLPASVRDRIKATEVLLDRGFGKAEQVLDMTVREDGERPSAEELLSIRKRLGEGRK